MGEQQAGQVGRKGGEKGGRRGEREGAICRAFWGKPLPLHTSVSPSPPLLHADPG